MHFLAINSSCSDAAGVDDGYTASIGSYAQSTVTVRSLMHDCWKLYRRARLWNITSHYHATMEFVHTTLYRLLISCMHDVVRSVQSVVAWLFLAAAAIHLPEPAAGCNRLYCGLKIGLICEGIAVYCVVSDISNCKEVKETRGQSNLAKAHECIMQFSRVTDRLTDGHCKHR